MGFMDRIPSNRAGHIDRKALFRIRIDQRQTLQLLAIAASIKHKVIRPNLIGSRHLLEAPADYIQSTPGLRHSADGDMGLEWSEWQQLDQLVAPNSPGVYRIAEGDRVIYIGESSGLKARLKAHARNDWGGDRPLTSFCVLTPDTPKQHLHEIENDLIAGHYHAYGSPPAMQFLNATVTRN